MTTETARRTSQRFALAGDRLAVALTAHCPYLYALTNDEWVLVALGAASDSGGGELELRGAGMSGFRYTRAQRDGAIVLLRGAMAGVRVVTEVSIAAEDRGIRFSTTIEAVADVELARIRSNFWFVPGGRPRSASRGIDAAWAPHRRPGADAIIAEPALRTPAVAVEQGGMAAILAPELESWSTTGPLRPALDLDLVDRRRDAPRLSFGLETWSSEQHGTFVHRPNETVHIPAGTTLRYVFDVWIDAAIEPGSMLQTLASRTWQRHGRRPSNSVAPQQLPFEGLAHAMLPAPLEREWHEALIGTTRTGGFPSWIDGSTISFGGRANALRSAYGLLYWGNRLDEKHWRTRAQAVRNLVLEAPEQGGCFPSGFDWMAGRWLIGDAECRGAGWFGANPPAGHYCVPSMAWTAYWMLRWHEDLRPDRRLLDRATRVGELLCTLQQSSGAFPTYVREADRGGSPVLLGSACSAAGTLLLAELGRITGRPGFLRAAARGAAHLEREIVPGREYRDVETTFGCASMGAAASDPHSGQPPMSFLAMDWVARALLAVARACSRPSALESGQQVLLELSLHQQVWSPPFVAHDAFGGFGASNADTQWSDVRQAQLAETFIGYARATGRADLFERGIAALRAAFTLAAIPENGGVNPLGWDGACPNHPAENRYGDVTRALLPPASLSHMPSGMMVENTCHPYPTSALGFRAGFDAGEGSALAGAAATLRHAGDVYVDVVRRAAHGLNGITVNVVRRASLEVEITERLGRDRTLDLLLDGAPADGELFWNGEPITLGFGSRVGVHLGAHSTGVLSSTHEVTPTAE